MSHVSQELVFHDSMTALLCQHEKTQSWHILSSINPWCTWKVEVEWSDDRASVLVFKMLQVRLEQKRIFSNCQPRLYEKNTPLYQNMHRTATVIWIQCQVCILYQNIVYLCISYLKLLGIVNKDLEHSGFIMFVFQIILPFFAVFSIASLSWQCHSICCIKVLGICII